MADMLGLELENLAVTEAWAYAGEESEGKVRHHLSAVNSFDVVHELRGLLDAQGLGGSATVGDSVMRHLIDRIGGHPILLKREFEEGVENASPVVDGLRAGVAALAVGGDLLGGQLRDEHSGEASLENAEVTTDVVKLGDRKKVLFMLPLFGIEVGCDGIGQGLLAVRGAVVGQREIEVEREGLGRVGEATKRGLGLMKLLVGEASGGCADAGLGLQTLDFQGLTLGGSLGAGREILADPLTVEPTGDAKNDLP